MNTARYILVTFVFVSIVNIIILQPATCEKNVSTVSIITPEPGIRVYLDGDYIGDTPIMNIKVDPGIHTVRLERKMYPTTVLIFNSVAGRNITINVPIGQGYRTNENSLLDVISIPPGLEVTINGAYAGNTPIYNYTLLPGIHYTIRVHRGSSTSENVTLKPESNIRYILYLTLIENTTTGTSTKESMPNALILLGIVVGISILFRYIYKRRSKYKNSLKQGRYSKIKKIESKYKEELTLEKPVFPKNVKDFPPALLERYEPLEFLGEGGFAKVFKVKRKKDGKIVALKIPRIDEKTSKTFIKEVSTWLHLNHENIVKLHDVDILPIPYLEMEFVEGIEIDGRVIRDLDAYPKPVDEETALKLVRGIAKGLKHAHSKGIYHRDLKPLNILLKSDLTPKITDWGLAKLGTMSSSRSVLGYTPLYASPEHLMPSKYGHTDARTDIWQLGVTFYELLTGRLPFEGYTYEEVFGKIVDEGYRFAPPSKINPGMAKYDGIFEKLLAKRKEDRYQSVDEFLRDLERVEEIEKKKAELEKEVEELKKSLAKSVEALKESKSAEEALKNRRLVVETLGKLALAYAELNRKAELLNTLNDLKFYTVQNLTELTSAISMAEMLIRESLPVSGEFIERLKVLIHNIERENRA